MEIANDLNCDIQEKDVATTEEIACNLNCSSTVIDMATVNNKLVEACDHKQENHVKFILETCKHEKDNLKHETEEKVIISNENESNDITEDTEIMNYLSIKELDHKIILPKLEPNEILIPRISINLKINALAIITAILVTNDDDYNAESAQVTLSLYCGLFNIYLHFIDVPQINKYLLKQGYKINEVSIEEWTTWISLKRKGVNQIMAYYFGEDERTLIKVAWTLLGPMLCLLGHKPNEANFCYWGVNVLKATSQATNLGQDLHQILFYPSLKYCKHLTSTLDKICEVRRHLFFIVYNTGSSIPKLAGAVCRMVVELLRGVGLLDFILIDHFLLIKNPFSLLLISIAKYVSDLLKAYEKFMEYGHLAPWCAIIGTPDELKLFQNPSLKFVAAIARGIAVKNGIKSLENYHPMEDNDEIIDTITKADQLLQKQRQVVQQRLEAKFKEEDGIKEKGIEEKKDAEKDDRNDEEK